MNPSRRSLSMSNSRKNTKSKRNGQSNRSNSPKSQPSSPKEQGSSDQASQHAENFEAAVKVLATGLNRNRTPTGPSQDLELIAPGQKARSESPPLPVSLSQVTRTEISDLLQVVEKKIVALAILDEKQTKWQAMVSGEKEIPLELRIARQKPGLAPGCKFSAKARLEAEEITTKQDREYLGLFLKDLVDNVIPEATRDLQDLKTSSERKLNYCIPTAELEMAKADFNKRGNELYNNSKKLLEERRSSKRKRPSSSAEHPSKRQRHDNRAERERQNYNHQYYQSNHSRHFNQANPRRERQGGYRRQ